MAIPTMSEAVPASDSTRLAEAEVMLQLSRNSQNVLVYLDELPIGKMPWLTRMGDRPTMPGKLCTDWAEAMHGLRVGTENTLSNLGIDARFETSTCEYMAMVRVTDERQRDKAVKRLLEMFHRHRIKAIMHP